MSRAEPTSIDTSGVAPGDGLTVRGPTLTLRYATREDAPALFELASDAEVTRWFSWGPYTRLSEPEGYIAGLRSKRERGELLDFLVVHEEAGPIGVTGLTELARRDRHATVGTWFGRRWWGSGVNRESKALIAALGFTVCALDRVNAWANVENGRSQRALEKVGFVREGVLRHWHRHGETLYDVAVYGLTRPDWEGSGLADVPVEITGAPPAPWIVADSVETRWS